MFTGLIEEVGRLAERRDAGGNIRLKVNGRKVLEGLKIGDSIAVSGPCLTVVEVGRDWFVVEAVERTVKSTTIAKWVANQPLNLERALRVGDRLGGHIVQGHIDAVARISRVKWGGGSNEIIIETPPAIAALIISKGSVAVDGVSLTVAAATESHFSVMIVPHTLENTTLSEVRPGALVNIETDIILRWLAQRTLGQVVREASLWTDGEIESIYRED